VGVKTWYITLKDHGMKASENRVLKTFGLKTGEVRVKGSRMHSEEPHDICRSIDVIRVIRLRRIRWVGHVARTGERRVAYRNWVGKPERKRALGRPGRRWEDNIKMDFKATQWDGVD